MSDCTPEELRLMLTKLQLSQRAAARLLEVSEREFRRMCAGSRPIPNVIKLALQNRIEGGAL